MRLKKGYVVKGNVTITNPSYIYYINASGTLYRKSATGGTNESATQMASGVTVGQQISVHYK